MENNIYEIMRPMPVFKPGLRDKNRAGFKSITRRVIDPQPEKKLEHLAGAWFTYYWMNGGMWNDAGKIAKCPYGQAGDFCYMREPLEHGFGGVAYYKDDGVMVRHGLTGEPITWRWKRDVLTSIFMPREAARSIFRYEDICVERVQEISRDDAKAEGVSNVWINPPAKEEHYSRGLLNPYVANYSVLWDEINAARGFGWDVNPWVWVLKYNPVEV